MGLKLFVCVHANLQRRAAAVTAFFSRAAAFSSLREACAEASETCILSVCIIVYGETTLLLTSFIDIVMYRLVPHAGNDSFSK